MKTQNLLLPLFLLSTSGYAQDLKHTGPIKNAMTVTLRIDGDCPMCEERIERVAFVKNEAEVDWVVETHMARVTFDSTRTSLDAIMQRVAQAGYDNELYLAPKQAYDKLPGCCQYERTLVHAPVKAVDAHAGHQHGEGHEAVPSVMDKPGYQGTPQTDVPVQQPAVPAEVDHLKPVFDAYFKLKDALVASDGNKAKQAASAFDDAVHGVPMAKLDHAVHMVWMKVMEQLMEPTHMMAKTTDLAVQRKQFAKLTAPLLELAKTAPQGTIYVDHCPMYEGGADWLSLEKPIRNPFYGSMMMSCGSVKETLVK